MFFNAPGNLTYIKKAIYLLAATTLGVLLSTIAHALIEVTYLSSALDYGRVVFYGSCALPPVFSITLLILGVVGGFLFGSFCWHKVYIEKAWDKKYSSQK